MMMMMMMHKVSLGAVRPHYNCCVGESGMRGALFGVGVICRIEIRFSMSTTYMSHRGTSYSLPPTRHLAGTTERRVATERLQHGKAVCCLFHIIRTYMYIFSAVLSPPTHPRHACSLLLQKYDAKASSPRTVVVMHHRSSSQKNVVRATGPGRPRVTTWGFSCSVIIMSSPDQRGVIVSHPRLRRTYEETPTLTRGRFGPVGKRHPTMRLRRTKKNFVCFYYVATCTSAASSGHQGVLCTRARGTQNCPPTQDIH